MRPGVATLDHTNYWSDFSGTEVDPFGCLFWAHSLEAFDDGGIDPPNPINRYQSWTAKLDLCADEDMFADFDGDGELTSLDWTAFTEAFKVGDRRADVDRDKLHTFADIDAVTYALRNVK